MPFWDQRMIMKIYVNLSLSNDQMMNVLRRLPCGSVLVEVSYISTLRNSNEMLYLQQIPKKVTFSALWTISTVFCSHSQAPVRISAKIIEILHT